MNDTSNRLYISDLDGTLLRNDAMLSRYAKRKLNALL
jgi:hydroxymethylpyrimidine pyrophosphatase-like HAD family hydrolase